MVYGKWRNVTSTNSLNALRFHEEDLALAFRNAKEYERDRAKGDMTVIYVRPPVKMVTQKMNSSDQLWHDVIGPAMISIGQRIDALKPVGALGSEKGSSIISWSLSKIPFKSPEPLYIPVLKNGIFRWLATKNVGRFMGRLTPMVGWGIFAMDIYQNRGNYVPESKRLL